MATSKAIPVPLTHESYLDADRHDLLGLTLSASLPLAVFVIANGVGELTGILPLFFSPFGLPGWLGAVLHIGSLPLLGAARWMVAERGARGRAAGWWLVALMAGLIVFPFMVTPLDSLQLSMVATSLAIIGMGAWLRAAAVSSRAAWVMAPAMIWLSFSALVGMAFVAAFTPPFGLANGQVAQTH
jgi:hypothetical protein